MADPIDNVATHVTQVSAAVAVTPAVASIFSIQWWNYNSAGVVAICAAIGAMVSVISFLLQQWYRGNFRKLFSIFRGTT